MSLESHGCLDDELPDDDFLVAAQRADLELARQIARECRRPVRDWAHDVMGPTEAWRDYLAENDPEWSEDDDLSMPGEVAA